MKFIKENFDKSVERERKIARFLESKENERKLSFGKKDSVRKWYEHDFADDAISVEDMDPSITFEVAASYVVPDANGEDRFYNKMGSVDSFVRENIFTKIAEIYGVSYDDVYETWMGTPDTKLLYALKADGVVECLTEEKEDGEENVYRVTYKASDKIFSSFMIKAKDKDEAIDKAMAYRKKKYDKDTDIVGAEKMSSSEVDDFKRRGMSLVEDIDGAVDITDLEKKTDAAYKKMKATKKGTADYDKAFDEWSELHGQLTKAMFSGRTISRKSPSEVVLGEGNKVLKKDTKKLKEDKSSDKDSVKGDIEALSDGDILVYTVADKDFPELYIMRNSEKPEYLVLWNENEDGEVANLVKFSSVDNAVYWVINKATSYTPRKLTNKHITFQEGKRVCEDMEEPEEIPASPETMDAMSVANTLNALIQDEWQAIDGYNGTISTYRAMAQDDYPEKDNSIDYDAIIKILEDIAQEEMNHVGMLQKAMGTISPNVSEIKGGEEEAEETLENPEAVEVVGEEDAE